MAPMQTADQPAVELSVIVPVCNERENIQPVYRSLRAVLDPLLHSWEIIFVDDGSCDGTAEAIENLVREHPCVKLIQLGRRFGQAAAIDAGFDLAQGEVIVTMDGDQQNDPADIPKLLRKLDEGYDAVLGWRKARKDPWLLRRLPSQVANWLVSWIIGVTVHDLGCGLRAPRRQLVQELDLCGGMHRFLAILVHQRCAKWTEVPVTHHARKFGRSKYGVGRTFAVLLDILTVKYMLDYFFSPMKWFGRLGLVCGTVGVASLAFTVAMKVISGVDMTGNPLLLLSVLSVMVSVQLISLGILGETILRLLLREQRSKPYTIQRILGFPTFPDGLRSQLTAKATRQPILS